LAKLDEVIRFCQATKCRRRFLLGYFGQAYGQDNCRSCDVCRPDLQAPPLPTAVRLAKYAALAGTSIGVNGVGRVGSAGRATDGIFGSRQPPKPPPRHVSELGSADLEIFERLRRLRKRLADERRVPAFVIFGDRTLKELAVVRPKDRAEFAGIFGVGEKKLETFAEVFLESINQGRDSA
jgi:ATP-dependent DNA helicase RecQ